MDKSIVNNKADPSKNSRQFAFYNKKGKDILSCVRPPIHNKLTKSEREFLQLYYLKRILVISARIWKEQTARLPWNDTNGRLHPKKLKISKPSTMSLSVHYVIHQTRDFDTSKLREESKLENMTPSGVFLSSKS